VHEAGPKDGLPLLLLHGWPELAFSWAPMVDALTGAGCHVIMPDLKGFGGSSAPLDPKDYRMEVLARDYGNLLDALEIEKAVLVGHDWGGAIAWPTAQRIPGRLLGVAVYCTPYPALPPAPPLSIYERKVGGDFYITQFQDAKLPDRTFGGREEAFFRFVLRPGPPRETWPKLLPEALALPKRFAEWEDEKSDQVAPPDAIAHYAKVYGQTGHESPTMLYRAIDLHWQERQAFSPKIDLPALMVTAERDMMLPPEASEGMEERIPKLSRASLDSGHWVTWERPQEAADALLEWLRWEKLLTG
jgi:pimeloyl-ACP methyl ester carboxylesterase